MQSQFYSAMRSCNQLHTCTCAGRMHRRTHERTHTHTYRASHVPLPGWWMTHVCQPLTVTVMAPELRGSYLHSSHRPTLSPLCRTVAITFLPLALVHARRRVLGMMSNWKSFLCLCMSACSRLLKPSICKMQTD